MLDILEAGRSGARTPPPGRTSAGITGARRKRRL